MAEEELGECYVSAEFPTFRVNRNRMDPRFFTALFRSSELLSQVDERSAGGTPTSRNRLKEAQFVQIEVPLPSLAVQSVIAQRIDFLFGCSRLRKAIAQTASAIVPSALNEAFAGLI